MDYFALMNGLAASRAGRQEMISDNVAEITNGLGPDYDYSLASRNGNEHASDVGKLPNHPTFSNQSAYHSIENQGGVWGKDVNGRDTYTPSVQMVQQGKTAGLAGYMASREPNTVLLMPAPYKMEAR